MIMMHLGFLFALLCASALSQPSPFSPKGPIAVSNWNYGNYLFPKNISLGLSIYAPSSASGKFPVLFFITAFEGMTPNAMYSSFFQQIASNGIIIVSGSKCKFMAPKPAAVVVATVLSWIQTDLVKELADHSITAASPDLENGMFIGGHSAGGHGVTQYLNGTCGIVKGLVLLDPVDGFDPWGLIPAYVIKPGTPVPFATPVLHLECGLDPTALNTNFPPCAPAKMSNSRFANAMRAQVWQLNATAYGHMDVCNPNAIKLLGKFCPTGTKTHDPHLYYDHTAGAIVSFFQMVYHQNYAYEKFIITPTLTTVDVLERHWVGANYAAHPKPFCTHF